MKVETEGLTVAVTFEADERVYRRYLPERPGEYVTLTVDDDGELQLAANCGHPLDP